MCDFKPGDAVACVVTQPQGFSVAGEVYEVARVWVHPVSGRLVLDLAGVENGCDFGPPYFWGHYASRFRKVERKTDSLSIESFLTIKPGFEEPRRAPAPAKTPERVQ